MRSSEQPLWVIRVCVLLLLISGNSVGMGLAGWSQATTLNVSSESTTLIEGTTLKLIVEQGLDTEHSHKGDRFVARLLEGVYSQESGTLAIPAGSWVTGRVVEVNRRARLSRAGKLALHLDYLVSVKGEMIPLNAILAFEDGKINDRGELDPQTGFLDKALAPTKKLLSNDAGQVISAATLGIPIVATFLGGTARAVVIKGDRAQLQPGDRLEITLLAEVLTIN